MAEQVNQRIEDMINELEQMRRTSLYDDEEIREISRKRKEFEYRIQRRLKEKDDFVQYIAYELALLEDISIRRKQNKLNEKKKDIEYAIAKRLNKVFKQFIYRFQNDLEIYFQYIKFCRSVGFDYAVSGIIGQMLQIHGDKPKMWLMASHWESKEQNNLENAKQFLLKGIHRHPSSDHLYLELFKIELMLALCAKSEEEKETQIKRANVIWRNGVQNSDDINLIFKLCDLSMKCEVAETITNEIKKEIWERRSNKEIWIFIASKELEGCHWVEIEDYVDEENNFPDVVNNYIAVYEEALQQFPDESLCTKFIHNLIGVSESICNENRKVAAIKHAWMYGHDNGLLSNDMYEFGIKMLKLENITSEQDLIKILDAALTRNPKARCLWEEKILLNIQNENNMLSVLQEATKALDFEDSLYMWSIVLDNLHSSDIVKSLFKKIKACESSILLLMKPKLLKRMYDLGGLKCARDIYEEFIRTPPIQIEVNLAMIEIEKSQEKLNSRNIQKCYECLVQHHGKDNVDIWIDYMKFEIESGNAHAAPAIYRRAVNTLNKQLVEEFIKAQTLAKIK